MIADLTFAPEAEQDIAGAYGWYETQRRGLGEEFISCLEARLEVVCRQPEMFPFILDDYRRALIRRFPFAVLYEFNDNSVIVYGVFHTSQDPTKWRR